MQTSFKLPVGGGKCFVPSPFIWVGKFCQAQFQLASSAELRFALYLIITTHPQDISDFYRNKHCDATGSSEGLIGCFGVVLRGNNVSS